jgi:hypothetical protein
MLRDRKAQDGQKNAQIASLRNALIPTGCFANGKNRLAMTEYKSCSLGWQFPGLSRQECLTYAFFVVFVGPPSRSILPAQNKVWGKESWVAISWIVRQECLTYALIVVFVGHPFMDDIPLHYN